MGGAFTEEIGAKRLAGRDSAPGMNKATTLLAFAAASCAHSGYRGLEPNDVALEIAPVYEDVPRVRETQFTNPDGTTAGTATTVVGYRKVLTDFTYKRGAEVIDEQDFYHLAKDRDGLDAVEHARNVGLMMNRVGIGIIAASLAVAIAVPVATGRENATYSVGQAFITAPIGLGLALFGQRRLDHHVLDADRGFRALALQPPGWTAKLDRD